MKDFDIVKYLKENKQGAYGMFNGYVDLKPLKEEEENIPAEDNSDLDADTVPYEGADDMITGNGEDDTYEQDDVVSEEVSISENRLEDLISRRDISLIRASAQRIFDDLTADGFEAEDVSEYLMDQIKRAAIPYLHNAIGGSDEGDFEAPEWQQDRTQNREFYEGKKRK